RVVHARCEPALAVTQVTDDFSARLREPSPRLYASTVWVAPLAPCAMERGPTVLADRRSFGAAESKLGRRKTMARRFRFVKPTREHPFYMPRCILLRGSSGRPLLPRRRTSLTGGSAPPMGTGKWFPRQKLRKGWR